MKITKKWLIKKGAGEEGLSWFSNQSETDLYNLTEKLIQENHENWAKWLILQAMNREQQLQYAIACAELVLPIFEKEYPSDDRPRLAIEAAKKVLMEDSKENRKAAEATAYPAARVAWEEASAAASAATWAAFASANTAYFKAVDAVDWAVVTAYKATGWKPILDIGVKILKGKN